MPVACAGPRGVHRTVHRRRPVLRCGDAGQALLRLPRIGTWCRWPGAVGGQGSALPGCGCAPCQLSECFSHLAQSHQAQPALFLEGPSAARRRRGQRPSGGIRRRRGQRTGAPAARRAGSSGWLRPGPRGPAWGRRGPAQHAARRQNHGRSRWRAG